MKQLRIVTAVCAFSLSMAQVKAEEQFLVDDGKANAEIVISESTARSTRLAEAVLLTYRYAGRDFGLTDVVGIVVHEVFA